MTETIVEPQLGDENETSMRKRMKSVKRRAEILKEEARIR